jgi:hypothetical protein
MENYKFPLIGITVSTKYDDILNLIIYQNIHFFTKWYIITDINDIKTINVIKNVHNENIEILYYDFWQDKAKFNKGGAIKYAQNIVYEKYKNENIFVLLLDSDIYLPNHFLEIYKNVIDSETNDQLENINQYFLYCPEHRYDYSKYSDFINYKNFQVYYLDQKYMGFFQLYFVNKNNPNKLYYDNSVNCASCDSIFRNKFTNKKIIKDLIVSHLGIPKVNWNTRKNNDDFIIDTIS